MAVSLSKVIGFTYEVQSYYNSYYYQMNQLSIFKLMKTNNMLLNLSAVAVMFQE